MMLVPHATDLTRCCRFEETKSQMEANTSALSKNIEQLQTKIELENEKAARLEKRISVNVGIGKQEAILQELGDKVTEVGFGSHCARRFSC